MKTPREILMERHRAAAPKLDALREEIVTSLNPHGTKAQSFDFLTWCLGGSKKLWQELFLPCRPVWTALAAVWLVLALVNHAQRDNSSEIKKSSAPLAMGFREQQKILNELFADRAPVAVEADRPKVFVPKPRTELANTECV